MAKPQILQQLTHDKLLTKANFPQFVETFNYTVNRCQNIKGDDDFVGRRGLINVDNTDPEHPIIRCNYDNLPEIVGDVPPDTELQTEAYEEAGVDGLSSIQYRRLVSADTDTPGEVLQLYRFDDPTTTTPLSDDSFVVRRENNHVEYVSMSSMLSVISSELSDVTGSMPPDANVPEANLSSIQVRELTGGEKVLQLFEFDKMQVSDPLSSDNIIVRRDNHIDYIEISALSAGQISVDTDMTQYQKSIQIKTLNDDTYLQLYKMDQSGENLVSVQLSTNVKPILPSTYEFVLRKGGAGGQISYANLNMACLSGGGGGGTIKAISALSREKGYFDYNDELSARFTDGTSQHVCYLGITISGTNNYATDQATEFQFTSKSDSNVVITPRGNNQLEFGVYYI